MTKYLVRRILQLIPVIIGVSLVIFLLLRLIPGDPARAFLGPDATEQDLAMVRARLGLDQPPLQQYLRFAAGLARGDLGRSIRTDARVTDELRTRYPTTIKLTAVAAVFMVAIGLPAGIISATRPNSWLDNATMVLALGGVSVPIFWLGLMLILVFAVHLHLLPAGGGDTLRHFILPGLALGLSSAAIVARLTRSSMLEVISQDYIRTARAKGLRETVIINKHALKNAMIPVVTIVGLEIGGLLAGAVLTETVFAINGLGRYIVLAINERDYPVVQGAVLVLALSFVVVNLVVDMVYALIDPRIRYR